MRNKLGYIVLVLLVSQLALILLSWLVTAAFPELPMRSVLSSEGIRWIFGSFVSNQLSPLLIYFIMAVMAVGACVRSRLYDALRETLSNTRSSLTTSSNHQHKVHYREKVGLRIALVESPVPSRPVLYLPYRSSSSLCHLPTVWQVVRLTVSQRCTRSLLVVWRLAQDSFLPTLSAFNSICR